MVLSHVKGQFNLIISNETVKKGVNWAGKALHSPEQRLILGATALATQPFIDLNNKDVDEETRKISAARTIAKIIAGTTVGVLVRYAGIWAAKRYSQFEKIFADADKKIIAKIIPDKKRGIFTPVFAGKTIFPISDKEFTQRITRHRKAMGTLLATVAMVFTNFLLDAPLTKYLTKIFQKGLEKPKEQEVKQ